MINGTIDETLNLHSYKGEVDSSNQLCGRGKAKLLDINLDGTWCEGKRHGICELKPFSLILSMQVWKLIQVVTYMFWNTGMVK